MLHFMVDRILSRYFLHQPEIKGTPTHASTTTLALGHIPGAFTMANTTAVFQLPCAPRGMIPIGSGPVPFDADVHSVATLTVTCGDNRRTEVERLGTELAVIVFKHLVDTRHHDLDDLEYR